MFGVILATFLIQSCKTARSDQSGSQYLNVSPKHSTTIGRILNPKTGYISPQYHVVHDKFTTVPNSDSGCGFNEKYQKWG
jgi:hypothetical protein